MEYKINLKRAQEILMPFSAPRNRENVKLGEAYNRVLSKDIIARENFPSFDMALTDGYAVIASDTLNAGLDTPVTLKTLEDIPAGKVPTETLTHGFASKIHAGAMIPNGADAVVRYAETQFTFDSVTLLSEVSVGENISKTGSQIVAGTVLAERGIRVTPAVAAKLAGQGITEVEVYLKPRIGIISTGSELVAFDNTPEQGKKRDSNRFAIEAALKDLGCDTFFLGLDFEDNTQAILDLINSGRGLDAMISTGGTGAGDRDYMTSAFDAMGAFTLTWGGDFAPCGSFAFATIGITPLIALPGDIDNALILLYAVISPALRKLSGLNEYGHKPIRVKLAEDYERSGEATLLLPGKIEIVSGEALIRVQPDDYDVIAVIEPGTESLLKKGSALTAFPVRQ
ncbi:MAG: molybdopterin molybdotransferase MoeA [Oscillospiraceae bacterium]|nr:molybdopterin molybdotransferase MoeA [Oscillospiraceae bacterium]